jgi:uncharacterized protein DUF6785/uncharacterized protein DUF6784
MATVPATSPVPREATAAREPVGSCPPRAVTGRSVALGLVLVPFLCWWSLRAELIYGGSELIEASLLVIVVFDLFAMVLLNEGLRRWAPRFAFSQAELLTAYVIQTTSVGVAGLGQMQFLPQALGGAFYFATPENRWADFHPLIPRWMVPPRDVLDAFYRGNSTLFTAAHLLGWARPMALWCLFILASAAAMLCLNSILRRQWIDHERLTFPLIYLPFELTRSETSRSLLRSRAFWIAFVIACLFRSVSGVHRVAPSFPDLADFTFKGQQINLEPYFVDHPWSAIGFFRISFHPMIVGITYFLPLDVAFSAWYFYLVVKAENVLVAAYGWQQAGGSLVAKPPYTGEQGAGAFIAVAALALWGARRHLAAVGRKAFMSDPRVHDSAEPISYRAAVFGFLAAFSILVGFMVAARMTWYVAVAFFGLYFLYILACTRFRAEAGPMLGYGPDVNPHRLLVDVAGARHWSAQDLTSVSYLQWFDSDYRTVAMPQQLEAFKLADASQLPSRRLSLWLLGALGLAAVASFVSILAIYYHYGATTPRGDNGWRIWNGRFPFQTLQTWLRDPADTDWTRLQWIGAGALVTGALAVMRARLLWWPFHPSGFALAQAGAAMQWVWFPTLLGWGVKAAILRYGGMKLYRAWIPFFLGLLLGDIVIGVIWSFIGALLDVNVYMFFPG